MKRKKNLYLTGTYILLTVLAVIWLIPIIWIFLTSFRGEGANAVPYFFPKTYTFNNYIKLFTSDAYPFGKWFINTFIVATCTCILSTLITVGMAYSLSRIKFKHRNGFLKLALVLNMFPGFMSMIAVYYILKALNLTQTLTSLVLVYSAGAALGFYIAKGFFDTIPVSLREAARLEGASEATIFGKIIIPLSKPMIVYTIINSFLNPWMDFVLARIMIKSKESADWTVAIGLYNLLQKTLIGDYFSIFCAGGVMIAIPISILFVVMQKFYVEGVTGGAVKG